MTDSFPESKMKRLQVKKAYRVPRAKRERQKEKKIQNPDISGGKPKDFKVYGKILKASRKKE